MSDRSRIQLRILLSAMELLERYPLLVKAILRPLASVPLVSRRMPVLMRAFMGATAFEIHDVDRSGGRIGIGGVEEIMAGAKIIHLLHTILEARLGEDEKNKALYEMGVKLCTWEVGQALEHGKWAPSLLTPLIFNASILDEVHTNPLIASFFLKIMNMMSRLITDEGGWGHLEFDLSSTAMRVKLHNSQEARWLGPSDTPVCHFYAGIVAGYASSISGQGVTSREVTCKAMGSDHCVFELLRE